MEIKGRIFQVLPLQSGTSKSGNEWRKQEYILETDAQYPKKICFNLFGDRIDQYPMSVGEDVIVSVDIESREFNGRWYTDIRAWKVDKVADMMQNTPMQAGVPTPPPADFFATNSSGEMSTDDLPF